jgi:hypothetical protein
MADKRISQLVDRGTVANSDVVPIVVSGAVTTNKATISSIQTFMQGNLDLGVTSVGITIGTSGTNVSVSGSPVTSSGNITINIPTASATNRGALSSADWSTFNSKVSSVGLSMPSAFTVANSPITGSGTIAVTGAGTVSQYVRGDGSLADFPQSGGGGGASVSYYLNGSVSQGTIGGIAYREINKTPILGAGTDFVAIADGYLASFITDAGDPALLEIPAGNWNFETYFSASSGGGSPTFYIELYKVDSGGTATLIASNSATPELIAFGTVINPYFSSLAVPTTVLTITDRLALRYYVTHSGRTITLHTENSHLCQIITTFTTGLTALNGLTAQVQNFATGTSGTDFAISSATATHTFNLPTASATNRGALSSADWSTFNAKQPAGNYVTLDTTQTITAQKTFTTSGGSDSVIITTTGAGFALDAIKAGNGEVIRVNKTSGSGNAMTVIGGNFEAPTIVKTGGTSSQFLKADGSVDSSTYLTTGTAASTYLPLVGGTLTGGLNGTSANFSGSVGIGTNTPEGSGLTVASGGILVSLDPGANRKVLELYATSTGAKVSSSYVGASSYGSLELLTSGLARLTIADTGGVTLTGALNGTSASFSGNVGINTATPDIIGYATKTFGILGVASDFPNMQIGIPGTSGSTTDIMGDINFFSKNGTGAVVSRSLIRSGLDGATTNNYFSFFTMNAGTLAERLKIASNGAATFATSASVGGLNLSATYATKLGLYNPSGSANMELGNAINTNGSIVSRLVSINANNGNTGNESSANFIGVASIETQLVSTSGNASGTSGANILFLTKADGGTLTERMRITSGGNVGIGLNSPIRRLHVVASVAGTVAEVSNERNNSSGDYAFVTTLGSNAINTNSYHYIAGTIGGADRLYIYGNGNVVNVNNSYGSLSDIKLKENIQDASPKLDDLMKVKIRNYNLIGEETKQIGVIAQELEEVFPSMVDESEDFEDVEVPQLDEEGNEVLNEEGESVTTKEKVSKGTTTKSVKYSVFVPILIKAMQEQQAQIQELKTEIDSLKNQIK